MNQLIQKGVSPMRKKRKRKSGGNPKGKSAPPYPFEFKLKLVRLYLKDNYSVPMLAQEFGVSEYSLHRWSNQYRENGEAGLVLKGRLKSVSRLSESVQEKLPISKKPSRATAAGGYRGPPLTSCQWE
jgi:transposase-like protein